MMISGDVAALTKYRLLCEHRKRDFQQRRPWGNLRIEIYMMKINCLDEKGDTMGSRRRKGESVLAMLGGRW